MRKGPAAQAAVGVLALGVAAILGLRFVRGADPAPTPARPVPAAAASAVLAVPADASAGSLALRWLELLGKRHSTPAKGSAEEELDRSLERQLAEEVRKRLAEDPGRWADVLEVLSQEDPRLGRKVVQTLQEGVGGDAEPVLLRLLKDGKHRETRMASATLVAFRSSSESLWALVAAAQQDPDSGVRYQALSELAKRQGRAAPAEAATIDQTLRSRAQVDPDPDLRQFALRVTGQASDAPKGPPPPRRPLFR